MISRQSSLEKADIACFEPVDLARFVPVGVTRGVRLIDPLGAGSGIGGDQTRRHPVAMKLPAGVGFDHGEAQLDLFAAGDRTEILGQV